jgi:hypothetical protein
MISEGLYRELLPLTRAWIGNVPSSYFPNTARRAYLFYTAAQYKLHQHMGVSSFTGRR